MLTREKYDAMPEEYRRECVETLDACKRLGECRPDEWDRIVGFYYEQYTEAPAGWFRWWED